MKPIKGFSFRVSGTALLEALKPLCDIAIPAGAHLHKIVSSPWADYTFEIVLLTEEGKEVAEGAIFPMAAKEDFDQEEADLMDWLAEGPGVEGDK